MHTRPTKDSGARHARRLCLGRARPPSCCERQPLHVGPRRVPFKYTWNEVSLASQNVGRKQQKGAKTPLASRNLGRKQHLGGISPKSRRAIGPGEAQNRGRWPREADLSTSRRPSNDWSAYRRGNRPRLWRERPRLRGPGALLPRGSAKSLARLALRPSQRLLRHLASESKLSAAK